jgi:hypothetical protein
VDQAAGDRRRQQRVAARDDPDAGRELLRRHVLEQEPAGARAQRLVDVLVEVERGEHEHARGHVAAQRGHLARRLDAVELGHADVHQHDVGRQATRLLDRRVAVGRLADDVDVLLGVEDHAEAGAHQRLVVGDQDADHSGSLATTSNPPPATGPARSEPSYSRMRSSIPTSPWPEPLDPFMALPPLSTIASSREEDSQRTVTDVGAAPAYLIALVSASCTTR